MPAVRVLNLFLVTVLVKKREKPERVPRRLAKSTMYINPTKSQRALSQCIVPQELKSGVFSTVC